MRWMRGAQRPCYARGKKPGRTWAGPHATTSILSVAGFEVGGVVEGGTAGGEPGGDPADQLVGQDGRGAVLAVGEMALAEQGISALGADEVGGFAEEFSEL